MRYSYELPVVQVACLESLQDVEWLWRTLNDGVLFNCIAVQYTAGGEYRYSLADLVYVDGFGIKSDSVYFSIRGDGTQYVAWNQAGKAYFISSHDGFSESLVPDVLQKLVYVKAGQ